MTTRLPGRTGGIVVKGLVKFETAGAMVKRLTKYVDDSPFKAMDAWKGDYSPVTV